MIKRGAIATGVRTAQIGDVNELVEIDIDAEYEPWDDQRWRDTIRDAKTTTYVALVGGVVGVLVYDQETFRDEGEFIIRKLVVSPESRRKGVGKALLKHARDKLAQISQRKMTVFVLDQDLETQQFFKAMGFKASPKVVHHRWGDEYEFSILVGQTRFKGKQRISDEWDLSAELTGL